MFRDLILKNRSTRRFQQDVPISMETLRELVDLARLSPSGGNVQPLKYIVSCDPEKNAVIFPTLAWAAHLKGWPGPAEGERPAAYIVILLDKEIGDSAGVDHGIAAHSILLGATEKGLSGCIIGSVKRAQLRAVLHIPERYDILLVVALGKAAETVMLEEVGPDGSTVYWRDEAGVHHVPKRRLDDLIVG